MSSASAFSSAVGGRPLVGRESSTADESHAGRYPPPRSEPNASNDAAGGLGGGGGVPGGAGGVPRGAGGVPGGAGGA